MSLGMAPTRFTELTRIAQAELIAIARESIEQALNGCLQGGFSRWIEHSSLRAPGASFVTLRERSTSELRGCCGSLEARLPLAEDTWRNARASAFGDPRFPSLTAAEWVDIDVHISVLSPPERFLVGSEAELLDTLRPHIDGLVLEFGAHRATFLPAVWEQLPTPDEFVKLLRLKAGLSPSFFSPQIEWSRYVVQEFGDEVAAT